MIPATYQAFFATSAGAGATLVGLLFVAISIAPERIFGTSAVFERQLAASTAFTALLNAFFISLCALIPGTNISVVTLVMGALGMINSLVMVVNLVRLRLLKQTPLESTVRAMPLVLGGPIIYGFELQAALTLNGASRGTSAVNEVTYLLIVVYGFAIIRAWEVLGANRRGLVAQLLLPLARRLPGDEEQPGKTPTPAASNAALPSEDNAPRRR